MYVTPFAMMIVNQEIRNDELEDDQMGRNTPEIRTRKTQCTVTCVRFPGKTKELKTLRHIPNATEQEKEILWYSIDELDRLQERDDADCLRAISTKGCTKFLDKVFLTSDGSNRQQVNLNCWSRYAENLRGFELDSHQQATQY